MQIIIDKESLILAALTVTTMFIGMRVLYGSWPWEYRKTWYATKVPNQIIHEIKQKIEPETEPLSPCMTVKLPIPFNMIMPSNDSFDRNVSTMVDIPKLAAINTGADTFDRVPDNDDGKTNQHASPVSDIS